MDEAGKLFIGGIHWNTTDEGMKAYFEQFGQVTESHIMRDPTGKSRCFGFVNFADPSVLDVVLQKTHILDSKQIDPKRAVPKHMQPHPQNPYTPYLQQQNPGMPVRPATMTKPALKDDCKIFVGGIHIAVEEPALRDFFQRYDEVMDVTLMRDHVTGRSRGFGFVTFASAKGVNETVAEKYIEYEGRRMEIKPAVPKGRQTAPTANVAAAAAAYGMDPNQYAAMAEYYKAAAAAGGGMAAGMPSAGAAVAPGQNPMTAAMAAAGYTDPKAYLDAMVQAYSASYGPEVAAQVAAYYAPYLNQASTGTTTTTSTTSTTSDKPTANRSSTRDRSYSPSRSRSRSRSPPVYRSSSRRTESGRRDSREGSRDRREGSRERYSRHRYRSRSRSTSRSPPPPPPPPPRRDRDRSPSGLERDRRPYRR